MAERRFEQVIIGVDPAGPDHDTTAYCLYEDGLLVRILSEEEYLALVEEQS